METSLRPGGGCYVLPPPLVPATPQKITFRRPQDAPPDIIGQRNAPAQWDTKHDNPQTLNWTAGDDWQINATLPTRLALRSV